MTGSNERVSEPGAGTTRPTRVALFQRVVPEYRVGVFSMLARQPGIQLTIYSGSFAARPAGAICLRAGTIRLGPRRLHIRPLLAMLLRRHDGILCEGRVP